MSEYTEKYLPTYQEVRENLIANGFKDFVETSESMYKEFKDEKGCVSCDLSTREDYLGEKMKFLTLMGMIDETPFGYWWVYWCDTCVRHNGHHPFHCEIIRIK
jgi:hypothetical protein